MRAVKEATIEIVWRVKRNTEEKRRGGNKIIRAELEKQIPARGVVASTHWVIQENEKKRAKKRKEVPEIEVVQPPIMWKDLNARTKSLRSSKHSILIINIILIKWATGGVIVKITLRLRGIGRGRTIIKRSERGRGTIIIITKVK